MQKHWSKRWVPVTSNRCPDHLSRQFLTTASTFPYSSKNSSAEHIHALPAWLIITNTLTHIDKHTHSLTHSHTHTHTYTHTHTHSRTHIHAQRDMYKEAWICSAEEFLELYGKLEAVVRNFLLRWTGHLFEVTGTHLFDQSFCFLCSDSSIFPLISSFPLLNQIFHVQKKGNLEPLYLNNDSRFGKIKKRF